LVDKRSRSVSAAPVCEDSEEKLKRAERSTDLGIDAFPAQDMMDVEVITRTCIAWSSAASLPQRHLIPC
jgi:hypothetical protein